MRARRRRRCGAGSTQNEGRRRDRRGWRRADAERMAAARDHPARARRDPRVRAAHVIALDDGDVRILLGDALVELATLPSRSVHLVVSSPPFWGLRDYGTSSWVGGDPACDHKAITDDEL